MAPETSAPNSTAISNDLRKKVFCAAEAVLERNGSIGPLELFMEMRWLNYAHFEAWKKGHEYYPALEPWIQVGREKFEKSIRYFEEWVKHCGLKTVEANYTRRGAQGVEQLQVTQTGDPASEKYYRTHYAPAELSEKKSARLKEKLNKAPDLVVFEKVSEEGNCKECGVELLRGTLFFMEKKEPLCLECADLDHLIFLPSGDATLSRRARKQSSLAAVVVRFSRARNRYERQGILVTEAALARAEEDCKADAAERAETRVISAVRREAEDKEFVAKFTQSVLQRYPRCSLEEARRIAGHAGLRSSGRVGRSVAGRALDARAVELAVIAHARHEHTEYDQMLMQGADRGDARTLVWPKIEAVLTKWTE